MRAAVALMTMGLMCVAFGCAPRARIGSNPPPAEQRESRPQDPTPDDPLDKARQNLIIAAERLTAWETFLRTVEWPGTASVEDYLQLERWAWHVFDKKTILLTAVVFLDYTRFRSDIPPEHKSYLILGLTKKAVENLHELCPIQDGLRQRGVILTTIISPLRLPCEQSISTSAR